MPAARPWKAEADAFLRDLRTVTGCVARTPLYADPNQSDPNAVHVLTFGRTGDPVPLQSATTGGPLGLRFDVRHQYRVVVVADPGEGRHPRWRVTTTAYEYRLLDHHDIELLVFHWQPGQAIAGPDHPHVHVSAHLRANTSATEVREIDLDKMHVPTGRVSLESLVRMLINEFGARPLREDWAPRLARTEAAFRRRRTQFDY